MSRKPTSKQGKHYDPDYLRAKVEEISRCPDKVKELDIDEVTALRRHINPLGGVVSGKESYANFSITNWSEKYLQRIITTGMVGFLFKMADEYEPEIELSREDAQYRRRVEAAGNCSNDTSMRLLAEHEETKKLITSTVKGVIKQFLGRHLEYNPEHHVRAATSENSDDPERQDRAELIKKACELAARAENIERRLRVDPAKTYQYMQENILATYQTVVDCTSRLEKMLLSFGREMTANDILGVLSRQYEWFSRRAIDLAKIAAPVSTRLTLAAYEKDPPIDYYYHFDRYMINHYEQLRQIVTAIYNEKPDIEFQITYYDSFKTGAAATEYCEKHQDEFKADVITVRNAHVNLLGPFKQNRDRISYYNRNTKILERMNQQLEADHKLGKDILEKRVRKAKKKNIEEMGADSAGLNDYKSALGIVKDLGAKQILTPEEQRQIADAKKRAQDIEEDADVPDDAIQCKILFTKPGPDGGTLDSTTFYTQAEAPLHMQEGSEFAGKYQPKRPEGVALLDNISSKTIVSKTGEKKKISALAKK